MHYLLFYDFVPDYATRRAEHRIEHIRLGEESAARGELLLAGAFAELDGAVLLFDGESPRAAEAFAEADPYVRHGLVTRWRVRTWPTVLGPAAAAPVSSAQLAAASAAGR
jgi:uncharacterized protein YciI